MPTVGKRIHKKSKRRSFYDTPVWRWIRKAHLRKEPVCRRCNSKGIITHTRLVVDHIVPRRLHEQSEVSNDNLSTLCHSCHAYKTNYDNKYHTVGEWYKNRNALDYIRSIEDNIKKVLNKDNNE